MSEWVIVAQHQLSNFSVISWREQVNFQWDDEEFYFVLDQHVDHGFISGVMVSVLISKAVDRGIIGAG
jgi:hypothetical protein